MEDGAVTDVSGVHGGGERLPCEEGGGGGRGGREGEEYGV